MEAAAGLTGESVEWILDTMKSGCLTVGRFFGHGNSHSTLVLQTRPGQYNNDALTALDRVLAALAARGLRAVLTLTDNWTEADSKQQVRWPVTATRAFYEFCSMLDGLARIQMHSTQTSRSRLGSRRT